MRHANDYTGKRFGILTVISKHNERREYWNCKCDCGSEKAIRIDHLKRGATTSCGCLNRERMRKKQTRHGMYFTKEYRIWKSMVDRCLKPYNTSYKNYGARGIKVCERWLLWENFWNDMKDGFSHGKELDRIDNSGNYEPGNCRWATRTQNANNKRTTVYVTAFGETLPVQEWGRRLGIPGKHIYQRIKTYKWTPEKALTT